MRPVPAALGWIVVGVLAVAAALPLTAVGPFGPEPADVTIVFVPAVPAGPGPSPAALTGGADGTARAGTQELDLGPGQGELVRLAGAVLVAIGVAIVAGSFVVARIVSAVRRRR